MECLFVADKKDRKRKEEEVEEKEDESKNCDNPHNPSIIVQLHSTMLTQENTKMLNLHNNQSKKQNTLSKIQ